MSMPRRPSYARANPEYPNFSERDAWMASREESMAKARASRDLDEQKYDALVNMGGIPCPGRYLGTRRKDGWHFMEVRLRASFQSRTYVMPRQVEWKGEAPELKWGDKVKDFV